MDDLRIKEKIAHSDGWKNILSGMGTRADKSIATTPTTRGVLPDDYLDMLYTDNGIASRIVDTKVDDMLRQGWHFDFPSEKENMENQSEMYNDIFKKMRLSYHLAIALKWARLYGGGIILLGMFDGQELSEELRPGRIRSIEEPRIFTRNKINYNDLRFQENPLKERFGKVEYYPVRFKMGFVEKEILVHHSRVIEVRGEPIPDTANDYIPAENKYWGISSLQKAYSTLADLGSSFGAVANLMQEVTIGRYKMADLAEILSTADGDKLVQNRIQSMDLMKSVYHTLFMDTSEDYVRDTLSLGGVSEILNQFFILLSANTGYPMTRLFGISPGGLNSTGDSDTYMYYDMVKGSQENVLRPILERIVQIISERYNLETPNIIFNPLEQMTEKEQAELAEKRANTERTKMETYRGYIDMGIMEPYMVEELEFGDSLKNIRDPGILPSVEEVGND